MNSLSLTEAIKTGCVTVRIQVYENYNGPNGNGRKMFMDEMKENGFKLPEAWRVRSNRTPKTKTNLLGPWEATLYFHKPKYGGASLNLLKKAKTEAQKLAPKSTMREDTPWGTGKITAQDLFIECLKRGLNPLDHVVEPLPRWISEQYAAG